MHSVVIVDDHDLARVGIASMLDPERFKVVGQAGDVEIATNMIIKQDPDVVLLDVHLLTEKGSEVIERVGNLSTAKYLALSVSDSPSDVAEVIKAGALGYVTKTISAEDLNTALEQVANGFTVFSPKLAGFLLNEFAATSPSDATIGEDDDKVQEFEDDEDYNTLSPKERQVLQMIARGYSYKQVAKLLGVAPKTVESHMSHVLRKLQLSNRNEVTYWAIKKGIV
jgi:DNA-binding NarL/FixJ family response regulator